MDARRRQTIQWVAPPELERETRGEGRGCGVAAKDDVLIAVKLMADNADYVGRRRRGRNLRCTTSLHEFYISE